MKSKNFYYLLITIIWTNCSQGQKQHGVVDVHSTFYGMDSLKTLPPLDIHTKIYFKNSQSIQEVPLIIYTDDSSGKKTVIKIKHYSYVDVDRNLCITYKSFADTTIPTKRYLATDSVSRDGGWNFLSNERLNYDNSLKLVDTIINEITYNRIKLNKTINGKPIYFILYSDCGNKRKLPIKLYKGLSDSIGCSIVRDDTFINGNLFMTRKLEYISDKLTEREQEVFVAWAKYAEEFIK